MYDTAQTWIVPCGSRLYKTSKSMYHSIAGCTPETCKRVVVDKFGTQDEMLQLRALFHNSSRFDRARIATEGVHAGISAIALDLPTVDEGIAEAGGR